MKFSFCVNISENAIDGIYLGLKSLNILLVSTALSKIMHVLIQMSTMIDPRLVLVECIKEIWDSSMSAYFWGRWIFHWDLWRINKQRMITSVLLGLDMAVGVGGLGCVFEHFLYI